MVQNYHLLPPISSVGRGRLVLAARLEQESSWDLVAR
jgi:hypothetical protein